MFSTVLILARHANEKKTCQILGHWDMLFAVWQQIPEGVDQRYPIKKGVLRNFTKFTEKHLCQSLFFNKVAAATLLKKNTFFTEHLWTTASEIHQFIWKTRICTVSVKIDNDSKKLRWSLSCTWILEMRIVVIVGRCPITIIPKKQVPASPTQIKFKCF